MDYAWFKADLLSELKIAIDEFEVAAVPGSSEVRRRAGENARPPRARSAALEFYRPHKIVPDLRASLNERMLAVWFMDDGHTRIRAAAAARRDRDRRFDDADLQVLLTGLQQLGLTAKALGGRIHFDVAATRGFPADCAVRSAGDAIQAPPRIEAAIPYDRMLVARAARGRLRRGGDRGHH